MFNVSMELIKEAVVCLHQLVACGGAIFGCLLLIAICQIWMVTRGRH